MTRLVLDRPPDTPAVPIHVDGCVICEIQPFTTTDQTLAAEFNRVHAP